MNPYSHDESKQLQWGQMDIALCSEQADPDCSSILPKLLPGKWVRFNDFRKVVGVNDPLAKSWMKQLKLSSNMCNSNSSKSRSMNWVKNGAGLCKKTSHINEQVEWHMYQRMSPTTEQLFCCYCFSSGRLDSWIFRPLVAVGSTVRGFSALREWHDPGMATHGDQKTNCLIKTLGVSPRSK